MRTFLFILSRRERRSWLANWVSIYLLLVLLQAFAAQKSEETTGVAKGTAGRGHTDIPIAGHGSPGRDERGREERDGQLYRDGGVVTANAD